MGWPLVEAGARLIISIFSPERTACRVALLFPSFTFLALPSGFSIRSCAIPPIVHVQAGDEVCHLTKVFIA